jgi:hypothetical protein
MVPEGFLGACRVCAHCSGEVRQHRVQVVSSCSAAVRVLRCGSSANYSTTTSVDMHNHPQPLSCAFACSSEQPHSPALDAARVCGPLQERHSQQSEPSPVHCVCAILPVFAPRDPFMLSFTVSQNDVISARYHSTIHVLYQSYILKE